jgi:hypothetical protein
MQYTLLLGPGGEKSRDQPASAGAELVSRMRKRIALFSL